jgi:hypothetical protein
MIQRKIYTGKNELTQTSRKVAGGFVEIDNEKFYKISNYNEMPDFFMSIVSDADHFMFISSNGALTAGRKNRNNALFPYYTDDKIQDYRDKTGSKTCLLVTRGKNTSLWEPFTEETTRIYQTRRNLYKSIYGNKLIFEEINEDLSLIFRYGWYNSDKFGIIKKASAENSNERPVKIELLDGFRNILPAGVDYAFQNEYSNLLDAYKKNERIQGTSLGIFALSAIPVDRAEPSEALTATTVWSKGLEQNQKILLSDRQINAFIKGGIVESETDIRAARGAYYVNSSFELGPGQTEHWLFAAEINQDSRKINDLLHMIESEKDLENLVNEDIAAGTRNLEIIVGKTDGIQLGNEELSYARHFSNALFNIMRGGIFTNNYVVETEDLITFVQQINRRVFDQYREWFNSFGPTIQYSELVNAAEQSGDPDLFRICTEYFPITFSRRHGDPSRPWNLFSIENKNPDGSPRLNYEGNWRDIFQNWEALSFSYPGFLEGMITRFVNASTADGYNPYRITREGIDWEAPDPNEPWAYIGYWGDHQIIYLLKFLEQSTAFQPGRLDEMMIKDVFVYAHVPYRIMPLEKIVQHPKDTIEFDINLHNQLISLSKEIGADGKLLRNSQGELIRANLTEKLLVMLLAKLSNFVPEAGIWMNTQRPEWNDANNALVGNGASMVTLYYIRRFLKFYKTRLTSSQHKVIPVASEISDLLQAIKHLFTAFKSILEEGFSDSDRGVFSLAAGKAGSEYRQSLYTSDFSKTKVPLKTNDLIKFIDLALEFMDQSIRVNRRKDGLYHAYNLISIKGEEISIRHLYEMLEGQVAVLSSGYLSTTESLEVLDTLKSSKLFRKDQYSYILYPDRNLPRFIEKNNISLDVVNESELLGSLMDAGDTSIMNRDLLGNFHFNSAFRNGDLLESALDQLDQERFGSLVNKEKLKILEIYESIFDHQSFTGRSGTFYGYEGLGSIYWHMVSKLLLAVQECYFNGISKLADKHLANRLKDHYYEIKAGIGLYKSPDVYGAFPTDAYSHTPANSGVKQPGLTGQVKEDLISRFGELGILIRNGAITFSPSLLNNNEILKHEETFKYFDTQGTQKKIVLQAGQLAYTFCQVPVVYSVNETESTTVTFTNGTVRKQSGTSLPADISAEIFARSGKVHKIECSFRFDADNETINET